MDRSGDGGIKRYGIKYSPLPSQQRFHSSTARFKGYSGSIGSGKSQALCQEAIRLAYRNTGRMGLIGAPTFPMLRDATLNTLLGILEENQLPYEYNKAENLLRLTDCESKILLRSVDDFERLRGTNLAWFGIDELSYVPEEAWLRLEGRLRDPNANHLCGFAVWTPKGFDWVYKRFLKAPVEGYDVIQARPFENRFILDQIPDFYSRLRSSYDETFYRQEVLGEYLSRSNGLVYSSFDRRENVLKDAVADRSRTLYWALDFNVDPMCSVVAQASGDGLVVLDEIVIKQATTVNACEEFLNRYSDHNGELVIYGDASGENMKTSGATDYQIIREFFAKRGMRKVHYRIPSKNPAVRDRVQLVNAHLKDADGNRRIHVAAKCKELISDFEEVTYKVDTTLIDKDRDRRRTHLSDALGYLVWQEFRPTVLVGEQGRRLL